MTIRFLFRRFVRSRSGAMGVFMAMVLVVSLALCALAVDVGSLYLERRTAQGAADLAALAAARDLDRAEAAARATLAVNGFATLSALSVVKGRYEPDPDVARGQRFVPGRVPHNAVRLDMTFPGQLYFATSFSAAPAISVSATGAAEAQAAFSIGSRLASVRDGVANALLGALVGGKVALSVMDYEALLAADVSLFDFLSALGTEIGTSVGTYDQVLGANATVGQILRAAATAAERKGETRAAQAIAALLGQAATSAVVPLGAVVDLGPLAQAALGSPPAGLAADVNVMSLLTAMATAANGGHQAAIDLAGSVPGLLSLKADLAIGERAQHSGWVAVGQAGATLRTAQMRLQLVAEVGGSGLLAGLRVRLPIYVELAQAEARLESVQCAAGQGQGQARIAARPAAVKAWIGDVAVGGLSDFGTSLPVAFAGLVETPLLSIRAKAYAEMANISSVMLDFSQSDVDRGTVKTAEVRDPIAPLVSHLVQTADIRVDLLGLGSVVAIKGALLGLLTPVASALDPLVMSLLDLAGVHLGEVDVRVHGIRCGAAVLAG